MSFLLYTNIKIKENSYNGYKKEKHEIQIHAFETKSININADSHQNEVKEFEIQILTLEKNTRNTKQKK